MARARLLSEPLDDHARLDGRRVLDRALAVRIDEPIGALYAVRGCEVLRNATEITVPAGFDTDYSSVPWFALSIMGPWADHDIAGVVHDWLFRVQAPRAAADRVWWIVARSGKRHVGPVRGFLGWAGLRLGGWISYRRRGREAIDT